MAEEDARLRQSGDSEISHIDFMMKQNLDVADYNFDRQIAAMKEAQANEDLSQIMKDTHFEKINQSLTTRDAP